MTIFLAAPNLVVNYKQFFTYPASNDKITKTISSKKLSSAELFDLFIPRPRRLTYLYFMNLFSGDPNGQIFAHWVAVYFGQILGKLQK
jgi:hypothetical protein